MEERGGREEQRENEFVTYCRVLLMFRIVCMWACARVRV